MDLNSIRYKGDLEDITDLYEDYDIKQIIDSHEEILKEHNSFRDNLLANSVRLTSVISPRIFKIINLVKNEFEIKEKIEFFSLNDLNYNALAFKLQNNISIVFTSALLENFSDEEILFVLGHELGHILFDHNRLLLLYNPTKSTTTFLPILAEKKFLRWQKKAEISCDRTGLIACKNYKTAVQALLKISYGLTEKNLNFNLPELMKQLDDLSASDYLSELSRVSHPILPVRLKALELFNNSTLINNKGKIKPLKLRKEVDALVDLTSFYPRKKDKEMMMKFIAAAGVKLLAHDKEIRLEEIKSLVQILAEVFTDDPEKEILYNSSEVEKQLHTAVRYLKNKGSDSDRYYSLHFLTIIALADGQFSQTEKKLLLKYADLLGFTQEDAMNVVWQTLQQNGINIDVKLNEIAENVKKHYAKLNKNSQKKEN